MTEEEKNNEFTEKIIKGLELSFERLLDSKSRNNGKLVVMRDGEIVTISADEYIQYEQRLQKPPKN